MSYVTQQEIKDYMGVTWAAGVNDLVDTLISAAEKYIEKYTGRDFEAADPDVDETRYYDGNGLTYLPIDDIRELTMLVYDGESLTVDEDFHLYPLNAEADGEPYTRIELIQPSTRLNLNSRLQSTSPYVFDEGQRLIAVTGKFGYSATPPDDIKQVALKLIGAMLKENIGNTDFKEINSEALGEYSISYNASAITKDKSFQLSVDKMLDPYVRKMKTNYSKVMQIS